MSQHSDSSPAHRRSKLADLTSIVEFFTIEDAAKYLSEEFRREVTPATLLLLALNGGLMISVEFFRRAGATSRAGAKRYR